MIRTTKDLLQHKGGVPLSAQRVSEAPSLARGGSLVGQHAPRGAVPVPPLHSDASGSGGAGQQQQPRRSSILKQPQQYTGGHSDDIDVLGDAPLSTAAAAASMMYHATLPSTTTATQAQQAAAEELKLKLERQRVELDNRTDSVNAIQRNFQRLSEMYSSDRQKLIAAEGELAQLREELDMLRAEKKLFAALRCEFSALQSEHEKLLASRDEERDAHQVRTKKLEEMLRASDREAKGMSASLAKIARDLQGRAQDDDHMTHTLQETETALNALLIDVMEWQKALAAEAGPHMLQHVGAGIAFVGGGGGGGVHVAADNALFATPSESMPLRVEVLGRALHQAVDAAIPALRVLCTDRVARLQATVEKLSMEGAQHALTLQQVTKDHEVAQQAAVRQVASLEESLRTQRQLYEADRAEWQRREAELESRLSQTHRNGDEATQTAKLAAEGLRHRLVQVEGELAEERRLRAADGDAIAALNGALAAAASAHQDELQQLRATSAANISAMEARVVEAATARKQADDAVKRLRTEQQRLEALVASMQRQLADAGKAAQAADAARLEALEQQLQAIKGALTVVESNREAIQGLYNGVCVELADAKKAIQQLTRDGARATAAVDALNVSLRTAEVRVTELMAERSQMLLEHHAAEESLATARVQLQQYQQLLSKAEAAKGVLEAECNRLKEELQRAAAGNSDVDAFRVKNKQLMDEMADLKSALLNASALSQVHQEKNQQLTKSLAAAESQSKEAVRAMERMQSTQANIDAQRSTLEAQRLTAEARAKHLREVQEETLKTVRKLINVEKACESGYSCQGCMQLLKDPVTCAPCGHTFCRKCFEEDSHNREKRSRGTYCPECEEHKVSLLVPSKALDLLTGKFSYRCQVLGDLCAMLEKDALQPPEQVL